MYDAGHMNMLIDCFGLLIFFSILMLYFTDERKGTPLNRLFLRMFVCHIVILLSDLLSWLIVGKTSAAAFVVSHTAVFVSYSLSYAIIPFFADYITALVNKDEIVSKRFIYAIRTLCIVSIVLLVVSRLNNSYYYIDENNKYNASEFFWFSQALGIISLTATTVFILRQKKSIGMNSTIFLLSYIFFPIVGIVLQMVVNNEIEFLFIGTTVSGGLIYGGIQARQLKAQKEREFELQRQIMNTAPICCQLWDENFNIIDCNEENVRFFRVNKKEDFFYNSGLGFVPEKQPCGGSSRELAQAYVERAANGERIAFDWVQLIEGELIPVEVTLDSFTLTEQTYVVVYVRDTRKEKKLYQLEKELANSKVTVMLSQIRPHFLYNSLVVIRHLCRTNPKAAEETVLEFSEYLRGNLDSLSLNTPIKFNQELRHVETYLKLEKKRFGDKLSIKHDIKTEDFCIPALTLQLIVENAIRHGVTKKENGGTVVINTAETQTEFRVTVSDDGVGFDTTDITQDDGRSHVGLTNARNRLAAMCGGSLEIRSEKGKGTVAVITIPKGAA